MTIEELRAVLKDYDPSATVVVRIGTSRLYETDVGITELDMVVLSTGALRPATLNEIQDGEAECCVVIS